MAVTPSQFRETFSLGAKNILETLRLADFQEVFGEKGTQTWGDYVCAIDDASFHGGMATVFLRQLLELGKHRVPIQAPDPRAFNRPAVEIHSWNIEFENPDERKQDAVTRGSNLAGRYFHLREELTRIAGWEHFSNWATVFLHCTGTLLSLATEVCAYQWAPCGRPQGSED